MAKYLNKVCLMKLFHALIISNFSYCAIVRHFCSKSIIINMEKYKKLLYEWCIMIMIPIIINSWVCQIDQLCSLYDLWHYWLKYSSVSGNFMRNSWTRYLCWTISHTIHAVAHCSSSLMQKQSNTELIHLYIKEPSNGIHYLPMPKIVNALT